MAIGLRLLSYWQTGDRVCVVNDLRFSRGLDREFYQAVRTVAEPVSSRKIYYGWDGGPSPAVDGYDNHLCSISAGDLVRRISQHPDELQDDATVHASAVLAYLKALPPETRISLFVD